MSDARQITLVTGATGFLGRRLCERLQADGELVRACGRQRQQGPWQEFVETDLTESTLDGHLFQGVTNVFHLASRAHAVSDGQGSTAAYREVIVEGTHRLVEAAHKSGVRKLVYFSSVKAMGEGNPSQLPLHVMDENWPERPVSPYGIAKSEAERIVLQSGIEHCVVLRPVMVFGPGQKGNLVRMMQAVKSGRFPPIPENGNRRSMIHVDDVIEYAIRSAQYPIAAGKTYILASSKPVSTRCLYDTIRISMGMPERNWSVPMFMLKTAAAMGSCLQRMLGRQIPFDKEALGKLTGSAWYSSGRAQRELGFLPRHEVNDWLRQ